MSQTEATLNTAEKETSKEVEIVKAERSAMELLRRTAEVGRIINKALILKVAEKADVLERTNKAHGLVQQFRDVKAGSPDLDTCEAEEFDRYAQMAFVMCAVEAGLEIERPVATLDAALNALQTAAQVYLYTCDVADGVHDEAFGAFNVDVADAVKELFKEILRCAETFSILPEDLACRAAVAFVKVLAVEDKGNCSSGRLNCAYHLHDRVASLASSAMSHTLRTSFGTSDYFMRNHPDADSFCYDAIEANDPVELERMLKAGVAVNEEAKKLALSDGRTECQDLLKSYGLAA